MDNKKMPREIVTQKTGMMDSLKKFFGVGKKKGGGLFARFRQKPPKPTGNRTMPLHLQERTLYEAQQKRARKNDVRQAVHHQQKKLGHHNFA